MSIAGGLKAKCRLIGGAWVLSMSCSPSPGVHARNVEPVSPSSQPQAIYGRSIALVVGIDKYTDLPVLGGAVRDAQKMAHALGIQGFQVTTLLDEAATRERVSEALAQSLRRDLEEDSRVLVYFAGHGATVGSADEQQLGYLMPVDAKQPRIASSGISMDEVQRWFGLYKAKHVMLIVDACYSGLALPQTRKAEPPPSSLEYLRTITQGRARTTLVAGTNQQVAHEIDGVGVFTNFVLEGMAGKADFNQDGLVTGGELAAYVQPKVFSLVKKRFDAVQTPQSAHLGNGEMVFFGANAPRAIGAPEEFSAAPEPAPPSPDLLTVESMLASGDYAGAWTKVQELVKRGERSRDLKVLEARVAERWTVSATRGETQTWGSIVDPLMSALHQAASDLTDKRAAADALAHIGWAHYLKSRDGVQGLQINELYERALALDPENPFAHAMLALRLDPDAEATKQHFDKALSAGRERPLVREFQFASIQRSQRGERRMLQAYLELGNAARVEGDAVPRTLKRELASRLYNSSKALDILTEELKTLIAPQDHLATLRWFLAVFQDDYRPLGAPLIEALLIEHLEGCEKARPYYEACQKPIRERLKPASYPAKYLVNARQALERCEVWEKAP